MESQRLDQTAVTQTALGNYLISMARTVEAMVNRAIEALLESNAHLASQVFLTEPHVNEMEIVIDEHAVKLLRKAELSETDVRLLVATIKINNDLERMGDLAVNISQRVISLTALPAAAAPSELLPMSAAVQAMVRKSLGALIHRNPDLASQVLASDDQVDGYRDQIFERLLAVITENPAAAGASLQFVLATRYLERIADHATNVAEDILFWVRGLEVRHGRGKKLAAHAELAHRAAAESTGL